MNLGLYLRYPLRSLVRGGSRTLLAVFCVAVGVMAIVALQLAGLTIRHSLTSDIRKANGGDIQVSEVSPGLSRDELSHLDALQRQGAVTAWSPTAALSGTARRGSDQPRTVAIRAVDPARYPLVGDVNITQPSGQGLRSLLGTPGTALMGTATGNQLHLGIGDQVLLSTQAGQVTVKITGLVKTTSTLSGDDFIIGIDTVPAGPPPLLFTTVYVTTPDHATMLSTAHDLTSYYPLASVQSTDDLLKSQSDASQLIDEFLALVGLLALLVGGIGIAHTMQVLLSRRRVEIAMLKTLGYRRRDLYLLFGLEAAWLGLVGGAGGAALGTGLSFVVTRLVERLVGTTLEPQLDLPTIASGLAVGVGTALTFGVLPIVKAAGIRPLAVLREAPEGGLRAHLATAGLLALLGALFALLAFAILRDLRLALISVVGALVALGILTFAFAVVGLVIGALPVPERLPLPRSWRVAVMLGFRGIGRQPGRTATTLVALFVGVFCIGLILILGQDLRTKLDSAISNSAPYNVLAIDSSTHADVLDQGVSAAPGVRARRQTIVMQAEPVAVNGQPIADFMARARTSPNYYPYLVTSLTSVEGSDLAAGRAPNVTLARNPKNIRATLGRQLTRADAGTTNVLGGIQLTLPPFNLHPGDTVTLADLQTHSVKTLTLVGFYQQSFTQLTVGTLQGDSGLVASWSASTSIVVDFVKVDPSSKAAAIRHINDADPTAGVLDLADFGAIVDQILGNLLLLLTVLASLALLAGAIIIANAVALALLERRREIGIMKSVGYQSRSVLGQVEFENALLGGVGGLSAMGLVLLATTLLGHFVFHTDLGVSAPITLAIIVGTAALAAIVSGLVAWAPARVRPLEVLRYE